MKALIIAEAGVNHNGSIKTAIQMVDTAREVGADIIKFQTFRAENVVTKSTRLAQYQAKNICQDDNQYEMLKRLELSNQDFWKLFERCQEKDIGFLSTAFDLASIYELASFALPLWKVPSGEITNKPYLETIAKFKKPVILSTGMATMDEVEAAVAVLNSKGCHQITLLHCTTEYPAPFDEVNLEAMRTMRDFFHLPVGYSDHTVGIEVAIAARALGASVIEKHFTLDRDMEGPDHKASLEPQEFAKMVHSIRNIESALGDGVKRPTRSELQNIRITRKSIVAKKHICKGDLFSDANLSVKRPGTGISPMKWYELIGSVATRDYEEDELIDGHE